MRLILIVLFAISCSTTFAQKSFLVSGSGSDKLAIIDKATQTITWSIPKDKKLECNSVVYQKRGKVAYSYKQGVALINKHGDLIFDYKVNQGEEAQCITPIKGGYLVGICGQPARIVELDKRGCVTKQVSYDCQQKNNHNQFRQVRKSSAGTYYIPMMGSKRLIEIDADGELLREFTLGQTAFSVLAKRDGNLLVPCGHSGLIYQIDIESGQKSIFASNETIGSDLNIEFAAEVVELKNGNVLLANWLGHNADMTQPILMEIDQSGKVVWRQDNNIEGIIFVSTVSPIY